MGVVATTAPSWMGTTGHGTVPRHMDPDGDATLRNPTTGVRACIRVWGGGRGICQYQRGTGWEERGEFSFWFLVNVKEREGSHG